MDPSTLEAIFRMNKDLWDEVAIQMIIQWYKDIASRRVQTNDNSDNNIDGMNNASI
jgi:hypothetical protein